MFPPKPSDNPQEWLNGLWLSLQRGGDHFGGEASLHENEEGDFIVRSRMNADLPSNIRKTVTAYMKQYAQASGWDLKASFKKNYVELLLSRAASSSSKK